MNGQPTPLPGADPTVAPLTDNAVFYGVVYGGSFSQIDGGVYSEDEELIRVIGNELNVNGNAKAGSIRNFRSLTVSGGTLNVAGGDRRTSLFYDNMLSIDGDIVNRGTIQAGGIEGASLTNGGYIGTLRDSAYDPGIRLTDGLINTGYIKTSLITVDGNFENSGKITVVGDVSVGGSFTNSGEFFFRSTVDNDSYGTFHQDGGLYLNGVDVVNTGFISTGFLRGVNNLSTGKLYVTGGAEITGNITIEAGAEVAFLHSAVPSRCTIPPV